MRKNLPNSRRWTGRLKPCLNCGRDFWCVPFNDDPTNGFEKKYCSNACYRAKQWHEDPDARMWAKVDKNGPNGCWVYKGARDRRGYGRPGRLTGGKNGRFYAHRRAYEIYIGPIPAGMLILHRCDNPPCCNPDHLFLGTDADNTADKIRKGRSGCDGERNVHAKLTEDAARVVKAEYRFWREGSIKRSNAKELASRYGVCTGVITAIIARRTWKHIN